MIEVDGDKIRIPDWTPIKEVRERLRSIKRYKPIRCPDKSYFTKFYNNIIVEPEPNKAQWGAWMFEIFTPHRTREGTFTGEKHTLRYLNWGEPRFMKPDIRTMFEKEDVFHFFQSNALIRHTKEGENSILEKADQKKDRYIWGFDYLCDIDDKDLNNAHKKAGKVIDFFHKKDIKVCVLFSGNKGFHVRVFYNELLRKNLIKKKERYFNQDLTRLHKKLNKEIKETTGVIPDTAVGGGELQLQRSPYTLHPASNLIALPLTKEQFENFTLDIVKPENVFKLQLYKRGLPTW